MASLRAVNETAAAAAAAPSAAAEESAAAAAAAAGAANLSASAVQSLKDEGNRLFKEGDFAGASEAYTRMIEACKAAEAAAATAAAAAGSKVAGGTSSSSAANFAEDVQLKELLAAAYCNRSMCRLKQQDASGAAADSSAALLLQPNYNKALYRKALALKLLGDLEGAGRSVRLLLQQEPSNKDAGLLLQQLREAQQQQQQQLAHSSMPSTLLEIAMNPQETDSRRVKALRDIGRLAQERHTLHEALGKQGLLQQLALFLKQQNAKKSPAANADAAGDTAAAATSAAAAAAPAVVEAAGWELVSSLVHFSPLGVSESSSSSSGDKVLLHLNEPLAIPERMRLCREAVRRCWTSEDLLQAFRRLKRQGFLPPPPDRFAAVLPPPPPSSSSSSSSSESSSSIGDAHWRALSAVYLLRVLGSLKQTEADAFEHDVSFLETVSSALDCYDVPAVAAAALHAIAAAADARRRLGLKAKALALRHGIERCLEAALGLLSAAADSSNSSSSSSSSSSRGVGEEQGALQRSVEVGVVSLLRLLGDKERSEADSVDMQRLIDQLLSPFLSCCCSKDPSKQADATVGLQALLFLMNADRESARDFILQGSLLPHILAAAVGEAAAAAGLAGTKQQQQQQQVGAALLVQCLDFVELRHKLLEDKGQGLLLLLLQQQQQTVSPLLRCKIAVAIARVCCHSAELRETLLQQVDFIALLQEFLLLLHPQQQQKQQQQKQQQQQQQKQVDEELGLCILELFFFLSLHGEFKERLRQLTAKQIKEQRQEGQQDLLRSLLDLGLQFCSSSSSSNSSSSSRSSRSSSLPRYLICGALCNLLQSKEDKKRWARSGRGKETAELSEPQLEELEAFYEQLPAEAKPVQNGEIDLGEETCAAELRRLLLQQGGVKLLVAACCNKPLPSPNVFHAAGRVFCLLSKHTDLRGLMVQQGAVKALLSALGCLGRSAGADVRDLQQAAAQLCISINPSLLQYNEALDLVPALLPLLKDAHELLQYEGALALTNLLAVGEDVRVRAFAAGAWGSLRELLFSDNDLLRAAGIEGWCNLASSERVRRQIGDTTKNNTNVQDLRLLLAFCLETNNTRAQTAAAGALAGLLYNSDIARALPNYDNYNNIFTALKETKEGDEALQDRLVACLYNICMEEETQDNQQQEPNVQQIKTDIKQLLQTQQHKFNKGIAADLTQQILNPDKHTQTNTHNSQ